MQIAQHDVELLQQPLLLLFDKLAKALDHDGNGDAGKHAKHYRDVVIPAMSALRETGDAIELMMPHELWPLATYREMLFIK